MAHLRKLREPVGSTPRHRQTQVREPTRSCYITEAQVRIILRKCDLHWMGVENMGSIHHGHGLPSRRRFRLFVTVLSPRSCDAGRGPARGFDFLIVLSAAGEDHLHTVWRICFGVGIMFPVVVFYFRMRMVSSKL